MNVSNLKSGDLLLCVGHNPLSCLIKGCTRSKFSHSAVVLRDPLYINKQLYGIYVLEAGYNKSEKSLGVNLQPIDSILQDYSEGDIVVRSLNYEIPDANKKILDAYSELQNKPYNLNPIDWIAGAIVLNDGFKIQSEKWFKSCFGASEKDATSFFCSAMVALFYVRLGILDSDCSFAILTPEHFTEAHDSEMPWLVKNAFGEETALFFRRSA